MRGTVSRFLNPRIIGRLLPGSADHFLSANFPEYQMRRLFYPILWSGIVSLLLLSLFIPQWRTHAQATGDGHQKTKISKRILDKVAEGQGSDTVDVIIEATGGADQSFD